MELTTANDVFSALNSIYLVDQNLTGDDYLKSLVENVAKNLNIQYVFIGRPLSETSSVIKTDFVWGGSEIVDNFEYDLKGTPCENVLSGQRVCIHEENVFSEFPEDLLLKEMGVEAYVGAPIITPDKELIGLFVLLDTKKFDCPEFLKSITEFFANRIGVEISRKRNEEKLSSINRELEEKVEEKTKIIQNTSELMLEQEKLACLGRLMSGIAHEIENPLKLIVNSGSVLDNALVALKKNSESHHMKENDQAIQEIVDANHFITKNSARIQNIVNDILLQSSDDLEIKNHDMKQLIEENVSIAFYASKLKRLDTKLEIIKDFPEQDINLILTTDIQALFLNIFENSFIAIQNTKKNSNNGIVKITITESSSQILITIFDNGDGIPTRIRANIFEPFFTTNTRKKHTGLGLYLVKSIVQKNFGEISIDSVEGEYTKVILSFPKNVL
ncbi:hypothetical protein A9Q84_15010 [Halobacteriovorax marinus]|uniref:histidine kinase n=1 Tax=Halobacteriovorax marinus TaxID=97084 RepID=A0A1Y5F5N6_9BACT|nr:hypothetical protein A9Q84_15010 [Halobacteriovorax marinus]